MQLEEVSKRTRVAVEYLEAIEEEAWERLPPGPYREAWVRAYCRLLHLPEPSLETIPQERGMPLWIPRVVGLTAVFAALALITWVQVLPRLMPAAKAPVARTPDQTLTVVARRSVPITVRVDGEVVFQKILPGDQEQAFRAFDRIEIDVPSVEVVKLVHNNVSIVPQGRQDRPRTLVFVDDLGR